MLEEYLKKTEPEYYPPVENLLDLIYEHYTENNPVEKNTFAKSRHSGISFSSFDCNTITGRTGHVSEVCHGSAIIQTGK